MDISDFPTKNNTIGDILTVLDLYDTKTAKTKKLG